MLTRAGTSLVELLVALTLAGVVLAAATGSLLRQQRGFRWVVATSGAEAQMRPVVQLLPEELALLDAAAGDLAPGQASDSTLELRVVVASSLSCDSAASALVLVPDATAGVAVGGTSRSPVTGDSLWFLERDSLGWQSRRITGVAHTSAGCALPPLAPGGSWRLTLDRPAGVPGATPVRLTRHERYAVYRASDGRFYLGQRTWSAFTGGFAAPQPIAGPFVRSLPSGAITGFLYFDSTGASVIPDGTNEGTIARVRVRSLAVVASIGAADSVRRDSADVALAGRGAH